MGKMIILGSGAAPGVPSIANGWGDCDPQNPKNRRLRSGTYLEFGSVKILIDTSPDLRCQILAHNIKRLDAVLYTHSHADHLHGIDDLRDLNRLSGKPLDVYANPDTAETIRVRFPYLVSDQYHPNNMIKAPSVKLHDVAEGAPFNVGGVPIVSLPLSGHAVCSNGYILNGGEIVYVADCKEITPQGLALIPERPKLLIMPLTAIEPTKHHLGLDKLLEYVKIINPYQTIINHMAVECDYNHIEKITPENVHPAYDNMIIEI